jgi:hypothetical protein
MDEMGRVGIEWWWCNHNHDTLHVKDFINFFILDGDLLFNRAVTIPSQSTIIFFKFKSHYTYLIYPYKQYTYNDYIWNYNPIESPNDLYNHIINLTGAYTRPLYTDLLLLFLINYLHSPYTLPDPTNSFHQFNIQNDDGSSKDLPNLSQISTYLSRPSLLLEMLFQSNEQTIAFGLILIYQLITTHPNSLFNIIMRDETVQPYFKCLTGNNSIYLINFIYNNITGLLLHTFNGDTNIPTQLKYVYNHASPYQLYLHHLNIKMNITIQSTTPDEYINNTKCAIILRNRYNKLDLPCNVILRLLNNEEYGVDPDMLLVNYSDIKNEEVLEENISTGDLIFDF